MKMKLINKTINPLAQASLLLICCTLFGCQPEQKIGVSIQGGVKVAGSPLGEGLITFVPIAETSGPKVSVPIVDGKYEFLGNEGLQPGQYRVEVFGLPPGIKAMMKGEMVSHSETGYKEIASQFNTRSTLQRDVDSGGLNRLDFEVDYASR